MEDRNAFMDYRLPLFHTDACELDETDWAVLVGQHLAADLTDLPWTSVFIFFPSPLRSSPFGRPSKSDDK